VLKSSVEKQSAIVPLELKNITRADVAGAPLVNVPKLGSVCVKTGVSTPSDTLCLAPSSKIEAKTIFFAWHNPSNPSNGART
jgi:hypothetical protein